MENLKNQLMRIVMEQDEEIQKLCNDNYYFREWQQAKKEKEALEIQIDELIETLLFVDPRNPKAVKQEIPVTEPDAAAKAAFDRFMEA